MLEHDLIKIVEEVLTEGGSKSISSRITIDSKLNTPPEWDSLNFVNVFMTVVEKLELDVEDDDAIHFTSIRGMKIFIENSK